MKLLRLSNVKENMRNINGHFDSSAQVHAIEATPELLIDLFVELNFGNVLTRNLIAQFTLIAYQLGFAQSMVNQVISIGVKEYAQIKM